MSAPPSNNNNNNNNNNNSNANNYTKQTVVDLARYLEKGVLVKLSGGRQGEKKKKNVMSTKLCCCFERARKITTPMREENREAEE